MREQIDDLLFSTDPTKRALKSETGYLKLSSFSRSVFDTAAFKIKLREKVGIIFDNYVNKVFYGENSSLLKYLFRIVNIVLHCSKQHYHPLHQLATLFHLLIRILCADIVHDLNYQ